MVFIRFVFGRAKRVELTTEKNGLSASFKWCVYLFELLCRISNLFTLWTRSEQKRKHTVLRASRFAYIRTREGASRGKEG